MKKLLIIICAFFAFHFVKAQCSVTISSSKVAKLCSNDSLLLTASSGFLNYIWSTGESNRTIIVKQSGYYKVMAKDSNNCIAIDSIFVQKVVKPSFNIVGSPQCDSSTYIFSNSTSVPFSNISNFTWNYGDGSKYISGTPNSIVQDSLKWTLAHTHIYTQNDVFIPTLIVKDKSSSCIDTFNYSSTGFDLPENIVYQIEILSKKSSLNNSVSDSICISSTGGLITLYNKYPLISKSGKSLNFRWRFNDANANPIGSDNSYYNIAEPTYEYKGLGQFFPTLTITCSNITNQVRTYNYYSKLDSVASNSQFSPAAINLTQLNTINGKFLVSSDTLYLKRNIYKNNKLTDSLSSKWTLFDKKQADTLKRITVNKLYGYGINIVGPFARIENPFSAGGPPPPNDVVLQYQKIQCGPNNPVYFVNNSLSYQANKLWIRWDFAEDAFAPACTSYSIPNPSAANSGLEPYTSAIDLQNRTLGAFIANGRAYLGRLNICNYSHDTMPIHSYTNWDVAFDWFRYGHDFPPYDPTRWTKGYTVWPTTQAPPPGFTWVQPRDTIGTQGWNKPMTAVGPTPTRIDTMINIWPADIPANNVITLNRDIPDPISSSRGNWMDVIPAGTIIDTGLLLINIVKKANDGITRVYRGSDIIPGISPPKTLYRYVFDRQVIQEKTVTLNMKDSVANASSGGAKCNSQSNIILNFTRPDPFGLGKNGIEGIGFKNNSIGGNTQLIFDRNGYLDSLRTVNNAGILPSNSRTWLLINYDSLLDRNDNTPCVLDGFVNFAGGITPGGTNMPALYSSVNYKPNSKWTSSSGSIAYVHYWPIGPTPIANGIGITNMPFDSKGNITIGLIVGTGCFSPTNCNLPSCYSDTVWYHNFFKFVGLNAKFTTEKFAYEFPDKPSFCYLRKKGDAVTFYYQDSIQDNILADIWNWGDGTSTIDSFYYTNNPNVPTSRKRFEFNSNILPWQVTSSINITAGVPVVNTEIINTYRCDDIARVFPPIKRDTLITNYYPGMVLKPISHVYTKSSYEQMVIGGNGQLERRSDITPVLHTMINNISNAENKVTNYLIIGIIDTFTYTKTNADSIFCSGETIKFSDSIRYWYPSSNCSRPLNFLANENDLLNYDNGNMHQWAYTKYNYPIDSIKNNITYDLTDYLIYNGTTAVCPITHNNLRVVGVGADGFSPVVRCFKNRKYFHERIYWDFESDGIIDAVGSKTLTNPINHIYNNAGTYKVSMISIDSIGARDTCIQYIVIKSRPKVGFTVNNPIQCLKGNLFVFNDTTSLIGGNMSRVWSFGNENTSTISNPNKIFTNTGNYFIKLKETNSNGCVDSIIKTVTVSPKPLIDFTINNPIQCINGNNFLFTDISTISSGSYTRKWNLGVSLNDTSSLSNPNKVYTTDNTYSIKLNATSNYGCKDSITKTVTVFPSTKIGFTTNNSIQCVNGNNFLFSDTSTISSGTYSRKWNLGVGLNDTSIITNPNKVFTNANTYSIKLFTTSNNGCKDSVIKTVTVNPKPLMDFTINNPIQCVNGNNFLYNDNTAISSGSFTRKWNLGNGLNDTSILSNPNKIYTTDNTYSIKLNATSNYGCKDSITKTVTVFPSTKIGFTTNNSIQCVNGNNFLFSDTSTISSGTYSRKWNLGVGLNDTSIITNPNKVFTNANTYSIKLFTTSNNGCKDSVIKTVTVNPKPLMDFTINNPIQCVNGNSFLYNDNTTISSGSFTRKWNLGNGLNDTSILSNPNKIYTTDNTYSIKLNATSNYGCKDSITKTVTVFPSTKIGFTTNNSIQCVNGNNFLFSDTSTISSGTYSRKWNLGVGLNDTSIITNPNKVFTNANTYSIKLFTTSNNGCKDSVIKTVTVNPKPLMDFTINNPIQCVNGNSFLYNDNTTISSGSFTRKWNLGNGLNDTSILSNPNKIYTTANTYSIKLLAISNYSCKDSIIKTVTVNPKPIVGFINNNLNQCLINNNYLFTDTSIITSGFINKRLWKISNDDTSTNSSINKVFNVSGVYSVKLIEESNYGCKDSITKTISVFPQPKAGFTINKDSQCLINNNFVFADTSINNSCIWNTGIGSNQTSKIANQTYINTGNYNIKLVVVSVNNCTDSTIKTITVISDPIVGPIVGQSAGLIIGNPYIYNVTQQLNHTYNWIITNGIIVSGQGTNSLIVQWVSSGLGRLKVEIKNTYNCLDTNSLNVAITSTGINEFINQLDFQLYPNPNNGNFTIQLKNTADKNGTIIIVDMLGRIVYETPYKLNNNEDTISISQMHLQAGTYNIIIGNKDGVVSRKSFVVIGE
jgi:PKD repeat protein